MMTENNYRYKFSIITAVYNAEKYLDEAVESVLSQSIGFTDSVELILIDDGSTDNSGRICDTYKEKYPENIKVVHKQNGGASSARNAGIPLAGGRYVNFMDSDDKLGPDTLSAVYDYFSRVDREIDFVSVPIFFFEGKEMPHRLNYKYNSKYNLMIDLWKQYSYVQMHASSSFFRRDMLTPDFFDTSLRYAEDAKAIMSLLMKKSRYGVVPAGRYYYRFRNTMDSAINCSRQHREWYLDCMKNHIFWAIEASGRQFGFIPKFVQFNLMYGLQSYFRTEEIPENVLSPDDKEEFLRLLTDALSFIDDQIILEQKSLSKEQKDYIISIKKDSGSGICEYFNEDARFRYHDTVTHPLSSYMLKLTKLESIPDGIRINGSVKLNCRVPFPSEIFVRITSDSKVSKKICSFKETPRTVFRSLGRTLAQFTDFEAVIPLDSIRGRTKLEFCMTSNEHTIRFRNLSAEEGFPCSSDTKSFRLKKEHLILKQNEQNLILEPEAKDILLTKYRQFRNRLLSRKH